MSELRWRDLSEYNDPNSPTHMHHGVAYRLADETVHGAWKVVVEDMSKPPELRTWAVYDLRRGPPLRALKVAGGIKTKETAMFLGQLLASSKPLRLAFTLSRAIGFAIMAVQDERRL